MVHALPDKEGVGVRPDHDDRISWLFQQSGLTPLFPPQFETKATPL